MMTRRQLLEQSEMSRSNKCPPQPSNDQSAPAAVVPKGSLGFSLTLFADKCRDEPTAKVRLLVAQIDVSMQSCIEDQVEDQVQAKGFELIGMPG